MPAGPLSISQRPHFLTCVFCDSSLTAKAVLVCLSSTESSFAKLKLLARQKLSVSPTSALLAPTRIRGCTRTSALGIAAHTFLENVLLSLRMFPLSLARRLRIVRKTQTFLR